MVKDKVGKEHPNVGCASFANECYDMVEMLTQEPYGLVMADANNIVKAIVNNTNHRAGWAHFIHEAGHNNARRLPDRVVIE